MRKIAKLMPLLLLFAVIIAGCSSGKNFKAETAYDIQEFSATNQKGDQVKLDSLKGKPWIAMFIFTTCTTVCPPMTANMADIQKTLHEKKINDYNIVGFTVDPTIDTEKKLAAYLKNYNVVDDSKWQFLTGYSQAFIEKFAVDSFKTLVKKTDGNDQVMHGTSFSLVDQKGVVVKSYSGVSNVPKDEIVTDLESIIEDGK